MELNAIRSICAYSRQFALRGEHVVLRCVGNPEIRQRKMAVRCDTQCSLHIFACPRLVNRCNEYVALEAHGTRMVVTFAFIMVTQSLTDAFTPHCAVYLTLMLPGTMKKAEAVKSRNGEETTWNGLQVVELVPWYMGVSASLSIGENSLL